MDESTSTSMVRSSRLESILASFRNFWKLKGRLPCASIDELNNFLCDLFLDFDQLAVTTTPGTLFSKNDFLRADSLTSFTLATPASIGRWKFLRSKSPKLFLDKDQKVSAINCQLVGVKSVPSYYNSNPFSSFYNSGNHCGRREWSSYKADCENWIAHFEGETINGSDLKEIMM